MTLTVNGNNYQGNVDASGNFAISLPGSDLKNDADTKIDASIKATDPAGNQADVTTTKDYNVDISGPDSSGTTLTVDDVTADNVVNASESGSNVAITGKVTGEFKAGDTVTLSVNGKDFTGNVDASGNYSISVPGSDLVADADTKIDAKIVATDAAGNTGTITATKDYSADTTGPNSSGTTLTVDDVTADNVVNASESGGNVAITGKVTGEFKSGDTVTLTVNNKDFTGTVDASGNYSINVPGSDLVADSDTKIDAKIVATDAAGNTGTITATKDYSADTTGPDSSGTTLTVDDVTADNVVNASESGGNVAVTGKVTGEFKVGDTVTLTVNNKDFTGTVDASGNYSINVPGSDLVADSDTKIDAKIVATDDAGNTGTITATKDYSADTSGPDSSGTTLTVNDVTADNVVNASESGGNVAITGKVTGEYKAGDTVTLTVNNKDFTGTVDAAGNYSINVPGSDLVADSDTKIDARVVATDAAGNTGTITATKDYSADTTSPDGSTTTLTVDDVTADNVVNASESGGNVAITGKVTGEFKSGDTVTLTVNGKDFTGTVDASGNYSINVPGSDLVADSDTKIDAKIVATDAAGNTGTITATKDYSADTTGPNSSGTTLTVDDVTADNVVNASESGGNVAITGKVTGEFKYGDTVTLTVNNKDFTGTVDAAGNYSINVPGSDLVADSDTKIDAKIVATDDAGNTGTITATKDYSADTTGLMALQPRLPSTM